jgi:putative drug exporter of the RND superfamily
MSFTSSLARGAAARPWFVVFLWALAVATSVVAVLFLGSQMTTKVGASGSESARAEKLAKTLSGGNTHEAVIINSTQSTLASAQFQAELKSVHDTLQRLGAKVIPSTPPSGAVYAAILLFEVGQASPSAVVHAIGGLNKHGFETGVYGPHFLDRDFHEAASADLRTAEEYGVAAALILLVLVFGTLVAALLPLALGIVATLVGLGILQVFGNAFEISVFSKNIVAGMGLALGIDYSLFMLSRYREERAHERPIPEAIEAMGRYASHAVVVSGTVVAVALTSMVLVPDRVLRSLALGAGIVTIVAVTAALTLLPALLRLLGDGSNRLAIPVLGQRIVAARPGRLWSAIARGVTAAPLPSFLIGAGVMVALATPALGLKLGAAGAKALPQNLPARRAFGLLEHAFKSATAEPTRVVITGDPSSVQIQNGVGRLEHELQQDNVFFGPTRVEKTSNLTAMSFYVSGDPGGRQAQTGIQRLRNQYIPAASFPASSDVLVGGPTADTLDYVQSIKSSRLRVFLFVLGLSFVLLAIAFRSLVIPLKALALNLLSVGAAYGVLVLVFQHGIGASVLGVHEAGKVEAWVPMLLFALLFGLSMDYHVFLLSRIREQYRERRDTAEAVVFGVVSTGRIITGAALIIVVVFASLARGNLVMFQELGLGVAVALLLDATIVRVVLVPSAMCVLGRWNWYPSRLSRVDVSPQPAPAADSGFAEQPTVAIRR